MTAGLFQDLHGSAHHRRAGTTEQRSKQEYLSRPRMVGLGDFIIDLARTLYCDARGVYSVSSLANTLAVPVGE